MRFSYVFEVVWPHQWASILWWEIDTQSIDLQALLHFTYLPCGKYALHCTPHCLSINHHCLLIPLYGLCCPGYQEMCSGYSAGLFTRSHYMTIDIVLLILNADKEAWHKPWRLYPGTFCFGVRLSGSPSAPNKEASHIARWTPARAADWTSQWDRNSWSSSNGRYSLVRHSQEHSKVFRILCKCRLLAVHAPLMWGVVMLQD